MGADAATYSPDTSVSASGASTATIDVVLELEEAAKISVSASATVLYREPNPGPGSGSGTASVSISGPLGNIASVGVSAQSDNYPGRTDSASTAACAPPGLYHIVLDCHGSGQASASGGLCHVGQQSARNSNAFASGSISFASYPPPSVTAQPVGMSVCPTGLGFVALTAKGAGPIAYKWRRDGIPLVDGTTPWGSVIYGADSSYITIVNSRDADSGLYSCRLSNDCDTTFSDGARYSVCSADFNCDKIVEDSDFVIFASAYNLLLCTDPAMPYRCPADINGDGLVDDFDFVKFAFAYDQLTCP